MTIERDGAVVRLQGTCPVEEAETLVALLQTGEIVAADLSACRHLHAALIQALLAFRTPLRGQAADPFLAGILLPAVARVTNG